VTRPYLPIAAFLRWCAHDPHRPHRRPWPAPSRDPARQSGRADLFEPDDYALYKDWLAEWRFGVACWAYCLTPNHVHLILTPDDGAALARALSRAHRLYAGYVNARARQTGHLFQGRFGSIAMDEDHLMAAAGYVALNPVRARLVERAADLAPFERARASFGPRRSARRRAAAARPGAEFRRSSGHGP
jgi:REP element-mobilizing transposase RayT